MRTVTLEFLRHGPPHGQLLSPLTDYLVVCGDDRASTVRLPFEHWQLLARMSALRYGADEAARQSVVRELAEALMRVFAQIPGLPGQLTGARDQETVHLELILSASELSLLPFELALAPPGSPADGLHLATQPIQPVSITRRVRFASRWEPVDSAPRILFAVAAPDGFAEPPWRQHLAELLEAARPWLKQTANGQPVPGEPVRVLPRASLEAIARTCEENRYTHVHLLAHGAPIRGHAGDERFGLALHGPGGRGVDVVDGTRLAGALHQHEDAQGRRCPSFVTIAACDGANLGGVIAPGASVAHDLHVHHIPLVVASQYPLTFAASVQLVRKLYPALLWGDDPRAALHSLRASLRRELPTTHDWASIVAYGVFPADYPRRLRSRRLTSAWQAANAALASLDLVAPPAPGEAANGAASAARPQLEGFARRQAEDAIDKLSATISAEVESYRERFVALAEAYGRLASTRKRMAWANALSAPERGDNLREGLRRARDEYRAALQFDPRNHWVASQYVALSTLVGDGKPDVALWMRSARDAARADLESSEDDKRGWALGTLAELDMLAAAGAQGAEAAERMQQAKDAIVQLCRLMGSQSFHAQSTKRQFQRYDRQWRQLNPALADLANQLLPVFEAAR